MNSFPGILADAKRAGRKITALTAYDYPTARLLDGSGIDFILVGDSLGMVVLGRADTVGVTLAEMDHHARAVTRGASTTPVIVDLPADTYRTPPEALDSARALMATGATGVKLEGNLPGQIRAITSEGIPLVAHLGMLPQHVREEGGYHRKGRTSAEADALLAQARSVEDAGACAVVLELVATPAATRIGQALRVPAIGIGSGASCDGQILVTHDLVGLFPWFRPPFAKPEADLAALFRGAVDRFIERTRVS